METSEKSKKITTKTVKKNLTILKSTRKDEEDHTYHQVNTISFQRNFNMLIGHFKLNEHPPRTR